MLKDKKLPSLEDKYYSEETETKNVKVDKKIKKSKKKKTYEKK